MKPLRTLMDPHTRGSRALAMFMAFTMAWTQVSVVPTSVIADGADAAVVAVEEPQGAEGENPEGTMPDEVVAGEAAPQDNFDSEPVFDAVGEPAPVVALEEEGTPADELNGDVEQPVEEGIGEGTDGDQGAAQPEQDASQPAVDEQTAADVGDQGAAGDQPADGSGDQGVAPDQGAANQDAAGTGDANGAAGADGTDDQGTTDADAGQGVVPDQDATANQDAAGSATDGTDAAGSTDGTGTAEPAVSTPATPTSVASAPAANAAGQQADAAANAANAVNAASADEGAIMPAADEPVTVTIIKLKEDGALDESYTTTVVPGVVEANAPVIEGYQIQKVNNHSNIKLDDTLIYSIVRDGSNVTVKTSADQVGAILVEDSTHITFTYEPVVAQYDLTYSITYQGVAVSAAQYDVYFASHVAPASIKAGDTQTFTFAVQTGYRLVEEPGISNGVVAKVDEGVYSVTGVTGNATVTIKLDKVSSYNLTFTGSNTRFTYGGINWATTKGETKSTTYTPDESVSFGIVGALEWQDADKVLNIITVTVGGVSYPLNLPSTDSVSNSAETTIGNMKVKVTYNGTTTVKSYKKSYTVPMHTVTFSNTNGIVAGDIGVYVNHKDKTTMEIWVKELTGVTDEQVYVETSKTSKTLKTHTDNFNENFAERKEKTDSTVYFNVASGYDASKITVKLVNSSGGTTGATATKLGSPVTKDGTKYNYSFTIPSSNTDNDVRIVIQVERSLEKVQAVYKADEDDANPQIVEIGAVDSFKVGKDVEVPTKSGYTFLNWSFGDTSYDNGSVFVVGDSEPVQNKETGAWEYVFVAQYKEDPTADYVHYTVKVYVGDKLVNAVDDKGPQDRIAYVNANADKSLLLPDSTFPELLEFDSSRSVTSAQLKDDGSTVLTVYYNYPTVNVTVTGGTWVYDGQLHAAQVTADDLPDGCYWAETPASSATVTNVIEGEVVATCDNARILYNVPGTEVPADVTDLINLNIEEGTIQITARPVKIASDGASKAYDGTPLVKHSVTVGGAGWAEGEGAGYAFTGEQTEVGSSDNEFSYELLGNTRAGNYAVEVEFGELTVTAADIAGFVELETADASKAYDGEPLAAPAARVVPAAEGVELPEGFLDQLVVEYSADGEAWTADPAQIAATDVADTMSGRGGNPVQVRARATSGNLSGELTGSEDVVVTPRGLEVTANSASKTYDGEPLTDPGYAITDGGFADGEGFASVTVEGSQTLVGASDNVVTGYEFADGAKAGNYAVTLARGTLKVTDGAGEGEDPVDPDKVIAKTHEEGTYALNQTVEFTITATNIYDAPKTMTFTEQEGVEITGEAVFEDVEPGAQVSTTARYTVTEADILAGGFTNTATVAFEDGPSYPGTDEVQVEDPNGRLAVSKAATSTPAEGEAYKLGETITYEVTVTNDGNLVVSDIVVTDELEGAILAEGESAEVAALAPGESATLHYCYTVAEADAQAGKVANTATAAGATDDPDVPDVPVTPGTDEQPVETPRASFFASKVASGPADGVAFKLGEQVSYTIEVVNNGNVALGDITVKDELTGESWTVETLPVDEKATFTTSYTVTEADVAAGKVENTVSVTGADPEGNPVETTATETVTTEEVERALSVEKHIASEPADGKAYAAGETVKFDVVVTNTGNQTLTNIQVVDELEGAELVEDTNSHREPGTGRDGYAALQLRGDRGRPGHVVQERGQRHGAGRHHGQGRDAGDSGGAEARAHSRARAACGRRAARARACVRTRAAG